MSKLPSEVVDWTSENIFFVASDDVHFGIQIPASNLHDRTEIIFLSWNLQENSEEEQAFTVAHEIAHAKLQHPSHKSSEEGEKMEKEADEPARKWLGYIRKPALREEVKRLLSHDEVRAAIDKSLEKRKKRIAKERSSES